MKLEQLFQKLDPPAGGKQRLDSFLDYQERKTLLMPSLLVASLAVITTIGIYFTNSTRSAYSEYFSNYVDYRTSQAELLNTAPSKQAFHRLKTNDPKVVFYLVETK